MSVYGMVPLALILVAAPFETCWTGEALGVATLFVLLSDALHGTASRASTQSSGASPIGGGAPTM